MPGPHIIAARTAATLLLAAGVAGCTAEPETPDPGPAAEELAEVVGEGDLRSLGEPGEVPRDLDELLDGALASSPRTVEVVRTTLVQASGSEADTGPTEATATLRWTWDLAEFDGEPWSYDSTVILNRRGETWTPQWDASVIHPELREGSTLDLSILPADRGDLVGGEGEVLVTERQVTRFGIARDQVTKKQSIRSARRLAKLLGIAPGDFARRVRAAGPRAFVEGLVLRQGDISLSIGRDYGKIPGALAVQDTRPLGPTADFAEPILGRVGPVTAEMIEEDPALRAGQERGVSGLQARYDDELAGTPGLQVLAFAADGNSQPVHEQAAVDGTDLALSLNRRLQLAAEKILSDVEPAAALVAVRPSDGALLAAANGPGTGGVNIATYGQAAPGSTFKIVSALALIRDGASPGARVDCPAATVVDGKQFENYDGYPLAGLGSITLRAALANSCNTAFVDAAERLSPTALAASAAALGAGVDHDLGFPAYFGQVPRPDSETEAAADMIGQGGVLASPMVMAVVTASVQQGSTVVPWLVDKVRSEVPDKVRLTGREADQLRGMLRNVVQNGSGALLGDVPGPPVLAKTGTAEFDRDGQLLLHAWMVAAQGDLAVAVYVDEGQSGSRTAGPLLERFLRTARR